MKAKGFLQKHKKLNYLQRVLRRRKDKNFVDEVLAIGYDPLRLRILQLG